MITNNATVMKRDATSSRISLILLIQSLPDDRYCFCFRVLFSLNKMFCKKVHLSVYILSM